MTGRLYKVTGPNGEAIGGGTGVWSLPTDDSPGDWMPVVDNPLPCRRGYHLVTIDQLPAWLGPKVWVAEFHPDATVVNNGDKSAGSCARLVAATAWNDRTARLFAADCAEHVLHLFEDRCPDDKRPQAAITAARRFADGEIDRATLAAATDAARAAARAAATAAATDAAAAAARAAATAAAAAAATDAAWTAAWAAATAAAAAAATDAAWTAAWAAAWDAARAAERRWQAGRLPHYLHPGEDA